MVESVPLDLMPRIRLSAHQPLLSPPPVAPHVQYDRPVDQSVSQEQELGGLLLVYGYREGLVINNLGKEMWTVSISFQFLFLL